MTGQVHPVLCGSSLRYVGVQRLLDAVAAYLPSPLDKPPVVGHHPKKGTEITRKPSPDEPFCGLVFKITNDAHGDLSFVRIYSGRLKSGSRVYNPGKDKKEVCSRLYHIRADDREQIQEAIAGDIVGIVGLKDSVTGDTLCDGAHPILLERIEFPETVISMSIEPVSSADKGKLAETLNALAREDPTFTFRVNEETGQTSISGMGELHLEILKNRMIRDFRLKVHVGRPRVSYRETIKRAVKRVEGTCIRQTGGSRLGNRKSRHRGARPVHGAVDTAAFGANHNQIPQVAAGENQGDGFFGGRLNLLRQRSVGLEAHNHSAEQSRRPNAAFGVHRHSVGPSLFDAGEDAAIAQQSIGGHVIGVDAFSKGVDMIQRLAVGAKAHAIAAFKAAFPDQRHRAIGIDSIEVSGIGVGNTVGAHGAASVDRSHKNAAIRIDGEIVEGFGQLARVGFQEFLWFAAFVPQRHIRPRHDQAAVFGKGQPAHAVPAGGNQGFGLTARGDAIDSAAADVGKVDASPVINAGSFQKSKSGRDCLVLQIIHGLFPLLENRFAAGGPGSTYIA